MAGQKTPAAATGTLVVNLRKHITYLASDKLEGRRTGEPGSTTAAAYIANEFAGLRLKPGWRSKNGRPNYLQAFPYIKEMQVGRNGFFFLEITKDGKRRRLSVGADIHSGLSSFGGDGIYTDDLPTPLGFSINGEVGKAKIVFAGYGIVADNPKYNDYKWDNKDLDVKGDVVIIFDGNPDNNNSESAFSRFDVRAKALIAKERGAVGMLIISRKAKFYDDELTRSEHASSPGKTALPTFVISRNTAQNILGISEKDLLTAESLTAMKKDPGVKTHVGFRDTKPVVSFIVGPAKSQTEAYNVIGILEGTDRTLRREAVVIGAHYDHLGHGGAGSLAANSSEVHHGADDNASGTAAIIEMARYFAKEKKNKRTLIFIAFSGEEEGLFGSKFYVNNPVFPLDRTVAMINLDMVGRLKDQKLTIGGIGTASEWNELVKKQNEILFDNNDGYGIGGQFALQLNDDGFGPSDHSSFYGKTVPVLFFFTGAHTDYHKPSDTVDKINFDGESKVILYALDLIKNIDKNEKRPTYTVAKVTAAAGGRTGFSISLGTIPGYTDSTDGMVIDGVRDAAPAAKAGMQAGDKIVRLAGHDIRNVQDYTFVLGEMKADVEYEIVFIRGGERLTRKITPVKRQ